ncbi:MAG: LytR C-terminal domain-containing protein [Candidatus Shapirobacteria bacterium]|nr:LytR C-terminal domain-containing protein [Candidatus Shapirobacteria bacterium]
MKNIKHRNKLNIKIVIAIFWLLFFAFILSFSFWKKDKIVVGLDHKLGVIAKDGIAMISISNERKMVNVLNLKEGSLAEFKDILEKEKTESVRHLFWYSFGFFPDKILVLDSIDQWKDNMVLVNNLGFINWFKYKKNYSRMLLKEEEIKNSSGEGTLILDEIMVRDFSESKLNNEELRLSVFNNTNESGLANFISKRLEWSGFSVVSTDNNSEKIDNCLIVYGNKTELNYGWKSINEIFDCEQKKDENLNENELEIYFGDNFASMIKYSSYYK